MRSWHSMSFSLGEINELRNLVNTELEDDVYGERSDLLEELSKRLEGFEDYAVRTEAEIELSNRADPWNELPEALGLKPPPDETPCGDASDPRGS